MDRLVCIPDLVCVRVVGCSERVENKSSLFLRTGFSSFLYVALTCIPVFRYVVGKSGHRAHTNSQWEESEVDAARLHSRVQTPPTIHR